MTLTHWLVLPLLAAVAMVPPSERGSAAARLILVVFALATMDAAVGSLAVSALRQWGTLDSSNRLFLSISCGLLVAGVGPWPPRRWRRWVAGVPLAAVLVIGLHEVIDPAPFILGAVVGALPLMLATILPRRVPDGSRSGDPRSPTGWATMAVAVVLALSHWLATMLLVPLASLGPGLPGRFSLRLPWQSRVLPVTATAIAVVIGWLALTIAGDPMVALEGFANQSPLSPSAERLLALLTVALVVTMAAPWPLHRLSPGMVLLPAAVIMAHRFAADLAPGGLPAWRPLAAMLLVPSMIAAAHRGHWTNVLGSGAVLVAMRPGAPAAVVAGIAMLTALVMVRGDRAADPTVSRRVTFPGSRWVATMLGAALALTTAAVLRDEVVLAILLTAGVASAAARPVGRLPAGLNSHLSPTFPPDGSDVTRTPPVAL